MTASHKQSWDIQREAGKEMKIKDLKALPTGTQEIKILYIRTETVESTI